MVAIPIAINVSSNASIGLPVALSISLSVDLIRLMQVIFYPLIKLLSFSTNKLAL